MVIASDKCGRVSRVELADMDGNLSVSRFSNSRFNLDCRS